MCCSNRDSGRDCDKSVLVIETEKDIAIKVF